MSELYVNPNRILCKTLPSSRSTSLPQGVVVRPIGFGSGGSSYVLSRQQCDGLVHYDGKVFPMSCWMQQHVQGKTYRVARLDAVGVTLIDSTDLGVELKYDIQIERSEL